MSELDLTSRRTRPRGRRMTATLAAIAALLAPSVSVAPASATGQAIMSTPMATPIEVADFSSGSIAPWTKSALGSDPADHTFTASNAPSGTQVGRIEVAVPVPPTGSGAVPKVDVYRDVDNLAVQSVTLRVRSAQVSSVWLALRDGSGRWHQQRIVLDPNNPGWQAVSVTTLAGGVDYYSWGSGGTNGTWLGGLDAISLSLTNAQLAGGAQRASVDLDSFAVVSGGTSIMLGDFEAGEGWAVAEHNGASGSLTAISGVDGRPTGVLNWRGAAAGGNIELHCPITATPASQVRVTLRSADLDAIDVWLRDSEGETHKQRLELNADGSQWQTIAIDDFDGGASPSSWGGDGDGTWSGSLVRVTLVATSSQILAGSPRPQLELGSVVVMGSAARPIAPLIVGEFNDDVEGWTAYGDQSVAAAWTKTTSSPANGAHAARVTITDEGPGVTGVLRRDLPAAITPTGIQLKVRTQQLSQLAVQLKDAGGETFQKVFPLSTTGGWQSLQADLSELSGWGDGEFDGHLKEILLVANTGWFRNGSTTAAFDVDSVVVHEEVPDLAMRPIRLGNVFTVGQQPEVGFASAADTVAWEAFDDDGILIDSGSGVVSALDGVIPLDLSADASDTGWYEVQVSAYRGGTLVASGATDVAVVPARTVTSNSDPRFGVATHYDGNWNPATIDLIPLGGYQFARDEAKWSEQEEVAGTIEWSSKVEAYTSALEARNLDLMLVLSYGNDLYGAATYGGVPYDAVTREKFADYAVAAVEKFGTDDTTYEVWNEWNINAGMGHLAAAERTQLKTPQNYAALLAKVRSSVKAAYPDAALLGPGSAGLDRPWMEGFAAAGGVANVDALTFHPYLQPNDAAGLQQVLDEAQAVLAPSSVPDRPIVLSELGWPTGTAANAVTEQQQSDYLVQSIAIALARGVERYTVYDLVDDGTSADNVEHRFGILRHHADERGSYVPKPSYVAVGVLERKLANLAGRGLTTPLPGTFVASFGAAKDTSVVWSNEPRTVVVQTTQPVAVTTTMGEERTLTPVDGRIIVTVDSEPLIISGAPITVASASTWYGFSVAPSVAGAHPEARVDAGRGSTAATVTVEGQSYTAPAATNQNRFVEIDLPVPVSEVGRNYTALVTNNGQVMGLLRASARTVEPVTLEVTHAVTSNGADVARIRATNNLDAPLAVDSLSWQLGSTSGDDALSTIQASATAVIDVPISSLNAQVAFEVALETQSWGTYSHEGLLKPFSASRDVPLVDAIAVNGVVDSSMAAHPSLDITTGVALGVSPGDPADLSGQLWWAFDDEFFYLTADIVDDAHVQTSTSNTTWQMDSIEFGVAVGAPGETRQWSQFGVAKAPNMSVLHRAVSASGDLALPGAKYEVTRNESTKRTVYEVAIPWELLRPAYAEDRLISLSAVVYDVDSAGGTRGWYRWGNGIVGGRDPAKYLPVLLEPQP